MGWLGAVLAAGSDGTVVDVGVCWLTFGRPLCEQAEARTPGAPGRGPDEVQVAGAFCGLAEVATCLLARDGFVMTRGIPFRLGSVCAPAAAGLVRALGGPADTDCVALPLALLHTASMLLSGFVALAILHSLLVLTLTLLLLELLALTGSVSLGSGCRGAVTTADRFLLPSIDTAGTGDSDLSADDALVPELELLLTMLPTCTAGAVCVHLSLRGTV